MNADPNPDFDIRDVENSDLEAVWALNQSMVPAVGSVDIDRMRWFATYAAYFRVAAGRDGLAAFLVGMRPGTSYESPNYQWFCEAYEDFGYIDRVGVHESARRYGLASRMYQDFDASLPPEVGVLTCEVNIEPPNESSMRFHERIGFVRVGAQRVDDGNKYVAMLAKERSG